MEMRRFRRIAGSPWYWPLALGMGAYWLFFFVIPLMSGNESAAGPEVVVRYVERELTLLEAGEGRGSFLAWWTGSSEEKESVAELLLLIGNQSPTEQVMALREQLGLMAAQGGEAVPDFSSEEAQAELLQRTLVTGGIRVLAVVVALGAILAGWRRWREKGKIWRLTGGWSPAWVLTVFFLAMIATNYLIPHAWMVASLVGGDHWSWLLADSFWRAAPGLLASFALVGSWSGVGRVFLGGRKVAWVPVVAIYGILELVLIVLYESGLDGGGTDPGDHFWVVDPGARELFGDVLSSVVFAPVFEELMFRGVLFMGLLRRLGTPLAALISTVLFAVIHTQYDAWAMFEVGLFGLACCWLTWRTGNIKSGIVLHMMVNGLIALDVWWFYQQPLP